MSNDAVRYQKLPARSYTMDGRCSLWLGDDHLLQAASWFVAERYRRFYFRDIEAVIMRPTRRRMWWNIAVGLVAMGCIAFASLFLWIASDQTGPDRGVAIVMASFPAVGAALSGIILIINTALGETCSFHVQTAAGVEVLSAITRRRAANRILERIGPLIHQTQAGSASPPVVPTPESAATP